MDSSCKVTVDSIETLVEAYLTKLYNSSNAFVTSTLPKLIVYTTRKYYFNLWIYHCEQCDESMVCENISDCNAMLDKMKYRSKSGELYYILDSQQHDQLHVNSVLSLHRADWIKICVYDQIAGSAVLVHIKLTVFYCAYMNNFAIQANMHVDYAIDLKTRRCEELTMSINKILNIDFNEMDILWIIDDYCNTQDIYLPAVQISIGDGSKGYPDDMHWWEGCWGNSSLILYGKKCWRMTDWKFCGWTENADILRNMHVTIQCVEERKVVAQNRGVKVVKK